MFLSRSGYVLRPLLPIGGGVWMPDGPSSEWISLAANEDVIDNPGLYVYQTTFNLAGLNPSTTVITGQWATDNTGVIYLNGTSTGFTSSNFGSFSSFTIDSGFVSGLNTLDFDVTNGPTGGPANPTGLRVEFSETAVPETSSLMLLGTGLVGVVVVEGFRRKLMAYSSASEPNADQGLRSSGLRYSVIGKRRRNSGVDLAYNTLK